uniref:HSF-type DNA-binding domain-containing protein n=1 Tax=Helicotheca tamesis TaxID=374047 RepID=A0A7S2HX23_9STRA|mmetsp:Transcript_3413/g.4626  ORF Transcript_3413/g.4626 Transcript_3413/m.4626 type:complete len:320 (+) Transcript_3413:209-1168(+)|eukprot:CAMPEP_0185729124 /NCGR_PEP_ID=MMETSP1171-20130828/4480_1 /TAXON_ID=374046 /ORGANISM="Helicotheca tamensis, Strain CCMP826" /LENGTH=319 /DNA_ID=CAMNT_0028397901 /DNA_START=158 /DNA_END=1117 /DNA_ORIENTATION=+
MIQERNKSILAAASALASLVEHPPRVDNKCMNPTSSLSQRKQPEERKNKPLAFPQKLMQVLSFEEYSNMITWLPHGRSFAIINPRDFVSVVLPAHFKRVKYSSFTRKLHRWGFKRETRGEEAGAFYHELFHRDNAELCTKMSMSKSKCDHCNHVETIEKMHIRFTPLLDRSFRESEKDFCIKNRSDPMNSAAIKRKTPLQGMLEAAPKHQASQLGLSKSMDLGFVENQKIFSFDQNMIDQYILSRRLRAINRATALSAHALMSMHPLQSKAGLLGNQEKNSVEDTGNAGRVRTTSRYFDKSHQKIDSQPARVGDVGKYV